MGEEEAEGRFHVSAPTDARGPKAANDEDVAVLLEQGGELLLKLEGHASAAEVLQTLSRSESPVASLVRLRVAEAAASKEDEDVGVLLEQGGELLLKLEGHASAAEVLQTLSRSESPVASLVRLRIAEAAASKEEGGGSDEALARGTEGHQDRMSDPAALPVEANGGERGRGGVAADEEQAAEEMAANQAFADLEQAATKIQALARGKSERRRHKERRERRTEAEQAAEEEAATEMYRGLESAAVKIQSRARGMRVRKLHGKRARRSPSPSPRRQEWQDAGTAEPASGSDAPARPRSALPSHARRPRTPHAPTSSPAVRVVDQETVERGMEQFRQEMLEAMADVQRDYQARCDSPPLRSLFCVVLVALQSACADDAMHGAPLDCMCEVPRSRRRPQVRRAGGQDQRHRREEAAASRRPRGRESCIRRALRAAGCRARRGASWWAGGRDRG